MAETKVALPNVDDVIEHLRVIRTWASCGAITQKDCPSVTEILDDALALIEAQRETLNRIDAYVRELDKAVREAETHPSWPHRPEGTDA